MFNLYQDAIDPKGFMGLVGNNVLANTNELELNSRRIVSGFAIVSLLIISVISNGSEYQQSIGFERPSAITSVI